MDWIKEIADYLNNNQGVISLIGFFLVIPLAILSEKLLSGKKRKKNENEFKIFLLYELWININFVAQIQRSYENNVNDKSMLHIPHYPPRTEVISKFLSFDLINCLNSDEKNLVIEVYSQLEGLKFEFLNWKENLVFKNIKDDDEIYQVLSSTMLSYIEVVMKNMLDLWIGLVKDLGKKSIIPQIRDLNKIILVEIKCGNWIRSSYKASDYNKEQFKNLKKFDVIMCWINDWQDCPKKVIEISKIVPIYESWIDKK